MRRSFKVFICFITVLVLVLSAAFTTSSACTAKGTTYYVNAVNGNDAASGTTSNSAWKTVDKVNSTTFKPGDKILFACGQTYDGMLSPKGSGTAGAPITLGSYGKGKARPIINGGDNTAAIQLIDQEYWKIENLETTGGNPYGIYVGTATENITLNYIYITNCYVHDVKGESTQAMEKATGCIVVSALNGVGSKFNQVVIDGCVASDTTRWAGIVVFGNCTTVNSAYTSTHSTNITIKNSTAYNVYGDGIVIFVAENCLIDHCVAHDVGLDPTLDVGTPNAIWTWDTNYSTVQYCEAYNTHSPGTDGGAFDIDYYNKNNIVQYNYAHDNDAYGISIFGASGATTSNSIVRYNVFANNGKASDTAFLGDIYLACWDGGTLDGVQIYNNTSFWNPNGNYAAVNDTFASYTGTNVNIFENNIIYSDVAPIINIRANHLTMNNNAYWYAGLGTPFFRYGGTTYSGLAAYQAVSGLDNNSFYQNPELNNPTSHSIGMPQKSEFTLKSNSICINSGANITTFKGMRDFFGNLIFYRQHNIGAYEGRGERVRSITIPVTNLSLSQNAADLNIGSKLSLKAYLAPDDATDVRVIWTSDNEGAATVDSNGIVTGTGTGIAIITATVASDPTLTATCTIQVERFTTIEDPLTDLSQVDSYSDVWFTVGNEIKVYSPKQNGIVTKDKYLSPYPVVTPSEAQSLVYHLDSMNTFRLLTAYYAWGKLYDYNTWSVMSPSASTDYSFKAYVSSDASLWTQIDVKSTLLYDGSMDTAYVYYQYEPVTSIPDGMNYIKLEFYDNDCGWSTVPYSFFLTSEPVKADSIVLNESSLTLEVSDYAFLTASVLPEGTANQNVIWHSDNTDAVVVSNTGFVQAVGSGTAVVSATSEEDASIASTCTVTVHDSMQITDTFDNLYRASSYSEGWTIANSAGTYKAYQNNLVIYPASSDTRTLTYKLHDLSGFDLTVAYSVYNYDYTVEPWDGKSHYGDLSYYSFSASVSVDGITWTPLKVLANETLGDYWNVVTYSEAEAIPEGMNYIMFEFMDNDQGWTTELQTLTISK